MDAYILVGGGNTRKSSSIRALTGASSATLKARKLVWDLAFGSATRQAFVLTGALQEGYIDPIQFISAVHASGVDCALFPLRYLPHNGFGSAEDYMAEFSRVGWKMHVSEMEAGMKLTFGSRVARHNASTLATNLTASALRSHWGIA